MPCKGCGWCCKNIFLTYPLPSTNRSREALVDWLEHRGAKKSGESSKVIVFRVRSVCPYLSPTGCTAKHKPEACERYPQQLAEYSTVGIRPATLLGRACGYRWNAAKEVFE